jgi:RNA-directed DNA polymerase
MARTTKQDSVRELQRTLYRAAKADPGRRFHALYDKVFRRDVLERAWGQVRANKGAAGIDQQTIADVEEYGVTRLLDELAADLKDGSYRASPSRISGCILRFSEARLSRRCRRWRGAGRRAGLG